MTTIGAAWLKQKENEEFYYSLSFDEAIMPFVIDKNKRFVLRENKGRGDNDKAPNFYIDAYIPDPNKKKPLQDPNIKKIDTNEEELENLPF